MVAGTHLRRAGARARSVVLLAACACGVDPDPTIAEAFWARIQKDSRGWSPLACSDRAAKVERLRPIVPAIHDLTGRVRDYDARLPPASRARVLSLELLGRAADYRCVVQDFHALDLAREPNYLAGQPNFANLYLLEARERLESGDDEVGWALVLDALELYRAPLGLQLGEHLELLEALALLRALAETRPPPPAIANRLADAVDATAMSRQTLCTAARHDLLAYAVAAFHGHFGTREREAITRRWGRAYAHVLLSGGKPGLHDRAASRAWSAVYDAIVPTCTKQPAGRVARQATSAVDALVRIDPPLGRAAEAVLERIRRHASVAQAQASTSALLRAIALADASTLPPPSPRSRVAQQMPSPYQP